MSRSFDGNVVAIEPLTLDIFSGEFVALLGPSGCGKSTLLRLIAGLDRPTAGTITLSSATDPQLAYVFQDAHLLPWRTALANVELPMELRHVDKAKRRIDALAALESVGLGDASTRYPAQLSGGMRMRVSLARAMVTKPNLLLLDEPFAALDEITRQQLDDGLRSLWRTTGMTTIFVTHSISEAAYLADRAVVMTGRPGRVVLDTKIVLPADRTAALRGAAEFAAESRRLYDALAGGVIE